MNLAPLRMMRPQFPHHRVTAPDLHRGARFRDVHRRYAALLSRFPSYHKSRFCRFRSARFPPKKIRNVC